MYNQCENSGAFLQDRAPYEKKQIVTTHIQG